MAVEPTGECSMSARRTPMRTPLPGSIQNVGQPNVKRSNYSRLVRLAIAAAGCALLLPLSAWADTVPLTGDSYINAGDSNPYGSSPAINIGPTSQGLILFDLNKLPAGTTGNSVASA